MWSPISRILGYIENTLAGALLIYAASMLCIQIIARSIFNYSFSWAEESVRYAIIWMVFMASSIAFRKDAHISIDVIQQVIPANLQKAFQALICLLCMVMAALLAYFGWQLTSRIFMFGQLSSAMEAPMYLFYAAIPVSSVFMFIRLTESLVRLFSRPHESEVVAMEAK